MKKITKAVIPAAGLGTRVLPATKAQPKEMLTLYDKPALQYIVEELVQSGITDILIVTGRNKNSIEDHFDHSYELEDTLLKRGKFDLLNQVKDISGMANIYYVRQNHPLGLGHAVLKAESFIGNEPFVVALGDDIMSSHVPVTSQLIDIFNKAEAQVVLGCQEVSMEDVSKYGIIEVSKSLVDTYRVSNFIEKPAPERAPSNLACLGRYILDPKIFKYLKNITPDSSGEIQLTDAIKEMCYANKVVAHKFKGKRFDIGDKVGLLKASIEIGLKSSRGSEILEFIKTVARRKGE